MIKEYFSKYKDDFKNCKNDLKNIKTWYRQIPNLLTISRPIGMIPANILFFTGNIVPAIILTGVLLLTDLFDGKLARKWNVQSKLGADLDAVGDKIMFLGMSLPLMVSNPLMIINLVLEVVISGINVYGRIKGLDTKTVYSGKIKMWFLSLTLGFGYLTQFFGVPVSVLRLLISATAGCQLIAIKDYITEFKKMKNGLKFSGVNEENVRINVDNPFEDDEKTLENQKIKGSLDELKKEREFVLAALESGRVYTGKKRVRKMAQEKKNS